MVACLEPQDYICFCCFGDLCYIALHHSSLSGVALVISINYALQYATLALAVVTATVRVALRPRPIYQLHLKASDFNCSLYTAHLFRSLTEYCNLKASLPGGVFQSSP